LEANSRRVLCRLFARTEDPRQGALERWLWDRAELLLPRRRVGDFNQALMELGALVCTPTAPRCGACPLANLCAAKRLGVQDRIRGRPATPELVFVQEAAVVLCRGQEVLIVQRPAAGRWAGMWEFPHAPLREGETHEQAARRLIRETTGLRARLTNE